MRQQLPKSSISLRISIHFSNQVGRVAELFQQRNRQLRGRNQVLQSTLSLKLQILLLQWPLKQRFKLSKFQHQCSMKKMIVRCVLCTCFEARKWWGVLDVFAKTCLLQQLEHLLASALAASRSPIQPPRPLRVRPSQREGGEKQ